MNANVDPAEINRFEQLAATWWDPTGESRPLHDLNPVRLDYVQQQCELAGARVADIGCGGGLLSEALARAGAQVTGIDASSAIVDVAKLHLYESGLKVDYRVASSAELAQTDPAAFDVVCCMELIEHVPDPAALLNDLAVLLKPGGRLILSTVNRNPLAFAGAIIGAEYVLRLLPRGTHHYRMFLRPSEITRTLRAAGLELTDVSGMGYNPLTHKAWLRRSPSINYLLCARARP